MKKAIVLGADYAYADKVMTTIKSICAHNTDIKFYLLNQDFPVEWTRLLNQKLYQMNSEIIDVKVTNETIKHFSTLSHINYAAYFRYFIPEIVTEDRCLYVDSDIIVTACIEELWNLDLTDVYLAAVPDYLFNLVRPAEFQFNTGFLLLNNKKWRAHGLTERLLQATQELGDKVDNGDQTVLNYLIKHDFLALDETYNLQIGSDYVQYLGGTYQDIRPISSPIAKVLHFITYTKPWNTFSSGRLREYWWHYYDMEWSMILAKWSIGRVDGTQLARPYPFKPKQAFILTALAEVEQLDYLVSELTEEVHFHVAAQTAMSSLLTNLVKYPNITLHPFVLPATVDKLLDECDLYLDINHGWEVGDIVTRAREKEKPIYAFDTTKHGENGQLVFSPDQVNELVEALKTFSSR